MIEQLCESCHEWENQEELVWDLKEDRLVCVECYCGANKRKGD